MSDASITHPRVKDRGKVGSSLSLFFFVCGEEVGRWGNEASWEEEARAKATNLDGQVQQ